MDEWEVETRPNFQTAQYLLPLLPQVTHQNIWTGEEGERLWRKESNPAVADPSEREATIVSLVLCFNVAENLRRFTVSQIK